MSLSLFAFSHFDFRISNFEFLISSRFLTTSTIPYPLPSLQRKSRAHSQLLINGHYHICSSKIKCIREMCKINLKLLDIHTNSPLLPLPLLSFRSWSTYTTRYWRERICNRFAPSCATKPWNADRSITSVSSSSTSTTSTILPSPRTAYPFAPRRTAIPAISTPLPLPSLPAPPPICLPLLTLLPRHPRSPLLPFPAPKLSMPLYHFPIVNESVTYPFFFDCIVNVFYFFGLVSVRKNKKTKRKNEKQEIRI